MAQILVVDDEVRMRHLLSIMLNRKGHNVEQAGNGVEALEMVKHSPYDVIITDIRMPRMDGISLLQNIKGLNLPIPVVFITAFATVDSAVEAMRQGAADYITKPFEEDRIYLTVERTLNLSRILAENRDLKDKIKMISGSDEIVYVSDKMKKVMDLAGRVAETDSHVLITGESGTGKELLARFIHQSSRRREGRFVPVNCAAISPNLVESELFGHERGSFTGADRRVVGKFEYASGGTLFLDEIGDLSLEAQAKLLRALEDKKIRRVGGNEEIPVNLRVVCATNRDILTLSKTAGSEGISILGSTSSPLNLLPCVKGWKTSPLWRNIS
jgi:DNA-binding NtrC family response regulator